MPPRNSSTPSRRVICGLWHGGRSIIEQRKLIPVQNIIEDESYRRGRRGDLIAHASAYNITGSDAVVWGDDTAFDPIEAVAEEGGHHG